MPEYQRFREYYIKGNLSLINEFMVLVKINVFVCQYVIYTYLLYASEGPF